MDLKILPYFDINTVADINKNKFAFTDTHENIYIVEKKNLEFCYKFRRCLSIILYYINFLV